MMKIIIINLYYFLENYLMEIDFDFTQPIFYQPIFYQPFFSKFLKDYYYLSPINFHFFIHYHYQYSIFHLNFLNFHDFIFHFIIIIITIISLNLHLL